MLLLLDLSLSAGLLAIGVVLLHAGVRHLQDRDGARIAILDYRLLPDWLVGPAASGLGVAEVAVGFGLAVGCGVATVAGLLLLLLFSAAALTALARGLQIDCHCFAGGEPLSRMTLARNVALAAPLAADLFRQPAAVRSFAPRLLLAPFPYPLAVGLVAITVAVAAAVWSLRRAPVDRRRTQGGAP